MKEDAIKTGELDTDELLEVLDGLPLCASAVVEGHVLAAHEEMGDMLFQTGMLTRAVLTEQATATHMVSLMLTVDCAIEELQNAKRGIYDLAAELGLDLEKELNE